MTNREFDKRLSEIFSEETIPYSEDNWERMQHILDSKQKPKTLLLLPLLYKKTAAAAAIAAAITAWYLYPTTNKETIIVNNNIQQNAIEYTTTPEAITATNNVPISSSVQIQIAKTAEKAILEKRVVAEQSNYEAEQKNTPVATNNEPAFQFDKPGLKKEHTEYILPLYDEPRARTTTFGINTGMAMYKNHNSFAAGLSISNKLSKRITLTAGLGFVQGQQDVSVKHITVTEEEVVISSTVDDTIKRTTTTISEKYEQYSKRLPYLQFNPSVSVKVFDKLYVNAGADVQRIITSQNTIDEINKHLAENNKQVPATDFGATAGIGYMVTKNIGMGATYRHSLMNKTSDGKEYIKRNYFMVQLQYIFNRK